MNNSSNETYNNTTPYNNDSNIINSYGWLFLCVFVFIINIFLAVYHKYNLNSIINKINLENQNINTLSKLIINYVKNDNIINKKNEIIKRRNSNKDDEALKKINRDI